MRCKCNDAADAPAHVKQEGNDAADATFICSSCFFSARAPRVIMLLLLLLLNLLLLLVLLQGLRMKLMTHDADGTPVTWLPSREMEVQWCC